MKCDLLEICNPSPPDTSLAFSFLLALRKNRFSTIPSPIRLVCLQALGLEGWRERETSVCAFTLALKEAMVLTHRGHLSSVLCVTHRTLEDDSWSLAVKLNL